MASELKFLESFNEMKMQLKNHLKSSPPLSPEGKLDSDYSVAEIRDLVVHGFESSQIVSALEYFITTYPIKQSQETRALLERFASNYLYLEQYTGSALQGTTIADYILSLPSNADRCLNLFSMLPRICQKFESMDVSHKRIGYFSSLRQFIAALTLYNNNRNQSFGMQDILTTHCYSFDIDSMTKRLKQEDMLNHLRELPLSTFETISGIKETITKFDIFGRKDGNLLNHVFAYSIFMNRLMDLKADAQSSEMNALQLEKILETDLFELIGDIIFDRNRTVSLPEVESIVCNLNTNLIHVITKNTCPNISICDKFASSPDDGLNDILLLLMDSGRSTTAPNVIDGMDLVAHSFYRGNRDVLDYVRGHSELVAYLLAEIHGIKLDEMDDEENATIDCTLVKNMIKMDVLNIRTALPEKSNRMVAALEFDILDLASARELILRQEYW